MKGNNSMNRNNTDHNNNHNNLTNNSADNNNHPRNNNSNSSRANQKKSRIIDRFKRRGITAISLRMITITSALSIKWPPRRWASP
jgi:hypothetical protein